MGPLKIVLIVLGVLALCALAFAAGVLYRKRVGEREIGSAEEEATRIINEAIRGGENRKKELLLEAKDEIHKSRTEYEKEVKERRAELTKQERRLEQKESTLDKKAEAFERKEEELNRRLADAANQRTQAEEYRQQQLAKLEEISGLTQDQAKQVLLDSVEADVRHDAAMKIKEIEQQTKDEADDKAREIIATAIQRCAADHSAETTVSVVSLPNDEMKGRIIGREGRNIRTIETLTGVDLIIDDTPEAITVSCFEPVRREIARLALEKLIADGRIHPTHIEEMVEKARREVDATIKAEGERVTFECGVRNLHPELVKMLGRLHYRTSYGQNVLQHSVEVSHIAGMMAAELGADVQAAKRAGLLHDLGKAVDHEMEGTHVALGVEFARKYKEKEEIIHAIEAHHNDVEPRTIIACLVQAADAISAARPGARRENLENYIKRLEQLETITGSYPGVDKAYAIQAGREVRVMVKPEQVSEDQMVILARDLAKKIEEEMEYPGQIKVHVLRETKVVEYAK
ncbi:MAG: ribonuclease Y [Candidatus Faecousia sp.]|nr:ribonuclease Y [Candidatus Faecousia sp.]